MSTLGVYLGFALGLFGVIKGGDWFVDKAVWFAAIFGIPQVILGATIVSLGTTLPETMVGSFAALANKGDITLGTAMGSILCNTGLVLGLSNVVRPSKVRDRNSFLQLASLIGVLVLLGILANDGMMSRLDSGVFLLLLIGFIGSNLWSGLTNGESYRPYASRKQIIGNLLIFVSGLVLVVGGARLLLDSGVAIARMFGVSEAIIAVTLFAVGSSLPELATAINAALKGHNSLLLGNILGANILNILMVVGVSGLVRPFALSLPILQQQILAALVLVALLLLPTMITSRITRWQAALSVILYVTYIAFFALGN